MVMMLMYDRESYHTREGGTMSEETHTPRDWTPVELQLDQGEHIDLAYECCLSTCFARSQ